MSWLIVAPNRHDDPALQNSALVADWTAAHASSPEILRARQATRANFERTIGAVNGVAFFGHGDVDRVFDSERAPGASGPTLLDSTNIHVLSGRWFHAFACSSGIELAALAARNGAAPYVGYRQTLNVSFSIPMPERVEAAFVRAVTTTTFALAEGVRDERRLRAEVSKAVDTLFEELHLLQPGAFPGWMAVHALAQQLVDAMVVTGSESTATGSQSP